MKGTNIVNYFNREGLVHHNTPVADWSFIYETSTVQAPGRSLGDRVVLPDGRVFRYAKSAGAINCDLGCKFMDDEFQSYQTIDASSNVAVGSTSITVNGGTHATVSKDDLRGGYVIIYHTGGGGYTQFRGIIGNGAAIANADFTVYLDAPTDTLIVGGTTGVEVFNNPYASIDDGAGQGYSFAGKAAKQVTAASQYFWVQTWGPCWIAPNITDGTWATNYHRGCFWRNDGSIQVAVAIGSLDADNTTQYAGFLINEGYSTGPLLMLQVCP